MNINLLPELACPSSATGKRCFGALKLANDPPARLASGSQQELSEGYLECQDCGASYPVLCGVAILVPDTVPYLQRHYKTILSVSVEQNQTISPAMLAYLHTIGAHIESTSRGSTGEDNLRALASYLRAHYDRDAPVLPNIPSEHILTGFSQAYRKNDLYQTLLAMLEPHLFAGNKIIDLGCHVGRLTRDLAKQGHKVIGIDTSFAAVFIARCAVRGWPSALESYEYFSDGIRREKRELDLPPLDNGEALVASATQTPFKPTAFHAAICANLIDILPEPIALLREIQNILIPGGFLGLSTPYHGGASQAVSRWMSGQNRMSAAQALRWRISHHFEILSEQDWVPWVLGDHERRFQLYLNHCIVGRKPQEGKNEPSRH